VQRRFFAFLSLPSVVSTFVLLTGCASTSSPPLTTLEKKPAAIAISTTIPAPSTTVYAGPPTLAPNESLPTPEALPAEGVVEPEVIIGELIIPSLMLRQTIYRGVSMPTLDKGVGYWPGTALPGHVGNVVLGGHRVSNLKPFRYLDLLKPGDEIQATTSEGTFIYTVRQTVIVEPSDIWIIDQTTAVTLTLFACHPVGSTKQRLVVFADYARQELL
jgi:sortase A